MMHEDAVRVLSVLAVELLQLTYLHRTQPEASVEMVLNFKLQSQGQVS